MQSIYINFNYKYMHCNCKWHPPTFTIDLDLPTETRTEDKVHWTRICHPFIRVSTGIPGTFHCYRCWPIRKSFTRTAVDHSFRIYGGYIVQCLVGGISQYWRRTTVYAAMVISISCNVVYRFPNDILWTSEDKSSCPRLPSLRIVTNVMDLCTYSGVSRWVG